MRGSRVMRLAAGMMQQFAWSSCAGKATAATTSITDTAAAAASTTSTGARSDGKVLESFTLREPT